MKKAVMYGGGNIGRGFIGQLLSESGYEVVFIDVNTGIIDSLNRERCYPIRILTGSETKDILIGNVRGVDGNDPDAVIREIAEADIMATAVGVNILPRIAGTVAEGLKLRWKKGLLNPLNIIICENLLDADVYLESLIKKELDEREVECFDKLTGLIEASIGRMVPVVTPEMQDGNILRVCVEEYCELPVDRDGFKGEIPFVKNMLPASPFSYYIQRKLFIHNMGHALTAYLGKLKGYNYIFEAIGDPCIKYIVYKAMQDSAIALSKEHGIKLELILDYADDLIYRFGNRQLADTIQRVGNDTIRKLSPNDRLIGTVRLCLKHGIMPVNACLGAAAAMVFDTSNGETLPEIQKILREYGPETVLRQVCNLKEKDVAWSMIIKFYSRLCDGLDLSKLNEIGEELKRKKSG